MEAFPFSYLPTSQLKPKLSVVPVQS